MPLHAEVVSAASEHCLIFQTGGPVCLCFPWFPADGHWCDLTSHTGNWIYLVWSRQNLLERSQNQPYKFNLYRCLGYFRRQQTDDKFLIFPETKIRISCKLSPMETIRMKCRILFSGEKWEKKSICRLLKMLLRVLSVNLWPVICRRCTLQTTNEGHFICVPGNRTTTISFIPESVMQIIADDIWIYSFYLSENKKKKKKKKTSSDISCKSWQTLHIKCQE